MIALTIALAATLAGPVPEQEGPRLADALALAGSEPADAGPPPALVSHILERLTYPGSRGTTHPTYVSWCRDLPDCEAHITTLVTLVWDSAQRHGVDPWIAVAVAWHESKFKAFAVGKSGSLGVMQVWPSARARRAIPFMRADVREECRSHATACQGALIDFSLTYLAARIKACGSVVGGLGDYNRGETRNKCGETGYARTVMRFARAFREEAGT